MKTPAPTFLHIALLAAAIAVGCGGGDQASDPPNESIVLLHGMGRTRGAMAVLGSRFENAGYRVHNFPYSQRTATLDLLSEELHAFIRDRVKTPTYHLIGHSLGNIIVRNGFNGTYREGLKRIVMIAPPNQPSKLAQAFEENPVYQWVTGDSGQKLADPTFYKGLPIPTVEFGIIAGASGHGLGLGLPNDGVIQVENTKLRGMADWVELNYTHTFIMNAEETFGYCKTFVETGSFRAKKQREPKR